MIKDYKTSMMNKLFLPGSISFCNKSESLLISSSLGEWMTITVEPIIHIKQPIYKYQLLIYWTIVQ